MKQLLETETEDRKLDIIQKVIEYLAKTSDDFMEKLLIEPSQHKNREEEEEEKEKEQQNILYEQKDKENRIIIKNTKIQLKQIIIKEIR